MDTGLGKLEPISEEVAKEFYEKAVDYFTVGEIVELKGSKFKVTAIRRKKIVLKILRRVS